MKEMRISVGGRELPCRLTMGAMLLFKRETGKDLNVDVVVELREEHL